MNHALEKFKKFGGEFIDSNFDEQQAQSARELIETWSQTISACYIVKDAAKDLARSLESLAKYVDEIIVVDTGSSDNTVDVAKKFGAKIFHETWQDDFATPRNVALNAAKSSWVTFLDADEYFINDTAKNLRKAIKIAQDKNIKGVLVNLVNVDADNDNKNLGASYVLRLYENAPNVNYKGKIHEQLFIGDKLLTSLMTAPAELLTIWHTGYSASIHKAKMERNLKSLLATKTPKRIYGYLAETYHALNDDANAEKFARLDFDSGETLSDNSTRILLEVLSKNPAQIDDLLKYLRLAIERYPAVPEFSAKLAETLASKGDYQGAINEMNLALDKAKNRGEQFGASTFDDKTLEYSKNLLAQWQKKIYEQLKNLPPAEKIREVVRLTNELIQAVEVLHNEKILQTAEKILAMEPAVPEPLEKVASIYLDKKMEDEAEKVVAYLEKNFPPSTYRLMLKARFHFLKLNMRECIKFAKRALVLDDCARRVADDLAHWLFRVNSQS